MSCLFGQLHKHAKAFGAVTAAVSAVAASQPPVVKAAWPSALQPSALQPPPSAAGSMVGAP